MRRFATLVGCCTALLWGTIPLLVVWATPAPPFYIIGVAFLIGWIAYLGYWLHQGKSILRMHALPLGLLAIGLIGMGGDSVLQAASLQLVPPLEANLIDATYPIMTFIFAAILLKARIAIHHVLGLVTSFIGVVLIVTGGDVDSSLFAHMHLGHMLALGSAIILALYAVYQAYRADITADVTGVFFGASAVMCLLCHALFEPSYLPDISESLAIGAIGIATCLGFLCWYYGMNYGDAPVIAASSYTGHLVSNALLVFVGAQPIPPLLLVAAILILGGALLAAKDDLIKGFKHLKSNT